MRTISSILLGWVVLLTMAACHSEEQGGQKIPPVPDLNQGFSTQQALELLTRVIRQYPGAADNYRKRAEIYFQREEYDAALQDINDAIDLKRNTGSFYVTKAKILRAKRKTEDALVAAQRAEILNVRTPELYILLADLYQQINQLGLARQYIARTLQINPFYGEAYFYRGVIAAKLGDTVRALALYMHSRALSPGFLDTYKQLSTVHYQLKQYPQSLVFVGEGLKFFPRNADLHFRRGLTFLRISQPDSAYREFAHALKTEPEHPGARFQAAAVLFEVNKPAEALKHLEVVEKVNPQYPGLNFLMAQCLEQTGNDDKAMDYYLLEAQQNPANRRAVGGYWRTRKRILTSDPTLRQLDRYRPQLAIPDKSGAAGDSLQ
ncbi:MAG: tetratricopeptide repeat protein [Siphonobacter aquaeclarae]|nr:tetratricopeptide repeat protein [Siphonobacter aquaeclarae]